MQIGTFKNTGVGYSGQLHTLTSNALLTFEPNRNEDEAAVFHGGSVEADHRRGGRTIPRALRAPGGNGKAGTPADLQTKWIGHSSLKNGDRYNHANEELEYRQRIANEVGMDRVLRTNGPNDDTQSPNSGHPLKHSA